MFTHVGNVWLYGLSGSLQQCFGQIVRLLVEILQDKMEEINTSLPIMTGMCVNFMKPVKNLFWPYFIPKTNKYNKTYFKGH